MFLTWKRLTALSYRDHPTIDNSHLTNAATAMGASHRLNMTSSLLRTSVVSKHGEFFLFFPLFASPHSKRNTYLLLKGILVN